MTSSPLRTDDGSLTFRHPVVGEAYHSLHGAETETQCKFIEPSDLEGRCKAGSVRLLDVGFGLGLNCRAALACAKNHPLHVDTIEHETQALDRGLLLFPKDVLITSLKSEGWYETDLSRVILHLGDVRSIVQDLTQPYDVIFHDPFSPVRNSECWTVELFQHLFRLLKPDGILVTYSQSKMVRAAMAEAGFTVQDTLVPPPQRGGTMGLRSGNSIQVEATLPFRDPDLHATGHEIRSRREAEVRSLTP